LKHLHAVLERSYLLLLNRLNLSLLPLIVWVLGIVPSMWNIYFNHRKIWVNSFILSGVRLSLLVLRLLLAYSTSPR
jgi:TRAP-type uncharacterized transport system fused permease subunit